MLFIPLKLRLHERGTERVMMAAWEVISILHDGTDNRAPKQQFGSPLPRSGRSQRDALPMFMKSDLYWQVMPKPKSLQKPVSFLITYRGEREKKKKEHGSQRQGQHASVGLSSQQLQEETQPQLWAQMEIFHGERMDLIGECYQLLLHRWDVFGASVDQSGVVLAEQHRVEHFFT